MGVILQAFYWHCPKEEQERCVVGLMNAIYRALVPGGCYLLLLPPPMGVAHFRTPPIAVLERSQ